MNDELIKYVFVVEKYEYENNSEKSIYAICKNKESLDKLVNKILETENVYKSDFEDDIFYYNQGKVYAYYLLLKSLGHDYKNEIVKYGQYQNWITVIKSLEEASQIQPIIIRNGKLNSIIAPNHLSYLNSYILKAQNNIYKIINKLKSPLLNKDK